MFAVVLPIALAITYVGLRNLVDVGETKPGAIDWTSVALSAFGFGPLVFGLSQLGEGSSTGPAWLPVAMLVLGVVSLGVFVLRQLRLQRDGVPLLDLRTLTHRTYALALGLMAVAFMAMLGSMILLPLYLQGVRGLSELQTGLLVMPGGLAMGLLGPQVGKVFDRVGGRPLVIPGSVGILVALSLLDPGRRDDARAVRARRPRPADVLARRGLHARLHPRPRRPPARTSTPTAARCSPRSSRSRPPSVRRSWSPWSPRAQTSLLDGGASEVAASRGRQPVGLRGRCDPRAGDRRLRRRPARPAAVVARRWRRRRD